MSENETNTNRNPENDSRKLSKLFLRLRLFGASLFPPLVFGSLVLGGWYLVSYGILDESRRFLLQPPHKVLTNGFLDWGGETEWQKCLTLYGPQQKLRGLVCFCNIDWFSHLPS